MYATGISFDFLPKAMLLRLKYVCLYRGYVRALYGKGNTLRKMGRYQEAEKVYKTLDSCCPTYLPKDEIFDMGQEAIG